MLFWVYFTTYFHKSQYLIPQIKVISIYYNSNINEFVERGNCMRDFSEIAKELRETKHLTQTQLAERMWVKKSIISAYETDARPPSLDMLIKYSKEFGVSTDYLLGLEGNRTIKVDGLTDEQINALQVIINEFLKSNVK